MPANRKVSPRQLELLIEFAEENIDIALGRCTRGPQAHLMNTRAWKSIATRLNSVADGVTKTGDQWRRYWIELKAKTKAKGADMRRNATKTGGGPNKLIPLSAIEERVLQIVGRIAVEGLPGVKIPCDFPDAPSTAANIPRPGSSQSRENPNAPSTAANQTTSKPGSSQSRENLQSTEVTPEIYMEVEFLDDENDDGPNNSNENVSPHLQSNLLQDTAPASQSPPHLPEDIVAQNQQHIEDAPSMDLPPQHQTRQRRHPRSRDMPRWALEMEERRLSFEEKMVGLMEQLVNKIAKIEERLGETNQHLKDINNNNLYK